MSDLTANRTIRDGDELLIKFNRLPTDEELQAVHDFLKKPPEICPFCKHPTYHCPCTYCGKPDNLLLLERPPMPKKIIALVIAIQLTIFGTIIYVGVHFLAKVG